MRKLTNSSLYNKYAAEWHSLTIRLETGGNNRTCLRLKKKKNLPASIKLRQFSCLSGTDLLIFPKQKVK